MTRPSPPPCPSAVPPRRASVAQRGTRRLRVPGVGGAACCGSTHLLVTDVEDAIAMQAEAMRAVGRLQQVLNAATDVLGQLLKEDLPARSAGSGRHVFSLVAARWQHSPSRKCPSGGPRCNCRSVQLFLSQRPRHARRRAMADGPTKAERGRVGPATAEQQQNSKRRLPLPPDVKKGIQIHRSFYITPCTDTPAIRRTPTELCLTSAHFPLLGFTTLPCGKVKVC
eukprot:scaffold82_cov105-Isochrysis_galbana.AAC.5